MEQIVVQVKDKEKARVLLELLTSLDFVDSVRASEVEEAELGSISQEDSSDFFSLAGLWQDREVTLELIRKKAWPLQYS